MEKGYGVGLLREAQYQKYLSKQERLLQERKWLEETQLRMVPDAAAI